MFGSSSSPSLTLPLALIRMSHQRSLEMLAACGSKSCSSQETQNLCNRFESMPRGYTQKTKSSRIPKNLKLSIKPNQQHLLAKMQNEQVPIRHFYNLLSQFNLHVKYSRQESEKIMQRCYLDLSS